jgi:hypothetical protein
MQLIGLERIRRSRPAGRVWALLALVSLRAVVPVGYMPAPIGEGGPFALCHELSAATIALLDAHGSMHGAAAVIQGAGHGDPIQPVEPTAGHEADWENCPLGIGAADAAIAFVMPLTPVEAITLLAYPIRVSHSSSAPFVRYRARAPPA